MDLEADVSEVSTSNVVDLMAALKKSLGQSSSDRPAQSKRKKTEDVRQTGLKLPIKGGKAAVERVDVQAATKPSRKRTLTLLPFFPRLDADLPSLLFRRDDAIDLGLGDHVADFAIADAAAIETWSQQTGNAPSWSKKPDPGVLAGIFRWKMPVRVLYGAGEERAPFPPQRIGSIGTMKEMDVYQSKIAPSIPSRAST